jgi:hypothetical protein
MYLRKAVLAAFACGAFALGAPNAKADAIYSGTIPTFGGGNENITDTLAILDAINPNIVYLGSYLDTSPGSVALPTGESLSGTGTGSSGTITTHDATNNYIVLYYDVKAGPASDLIQVSSPASTVDWTTNWSNLHVGNGNVPNISHIDAFGIDPPAPVPEPSPLMLLASGLAALGFLSWKRKAS